MAREFGFVDAGDTILPVLEIPVAATTEVVDGDIDHNAADPGFELPLRPASFEVEEYVLKSPVHILHGIVAIGGVAQTDPHGETAETGV